MQLEDPDLSSHISHQQHKSIAHSKRIAVCIANGTLSGFNQTLLLILPIAIFLPIFSINTLPFVYVSIILINFILHKAHGKFSKHISSAKPTFFYSILSALLILALWWDLVYYTHLWASFALLIVSIPLISLSNLQLNELNRSLLLNNMYSIHRAVNICQLAAIGVGGLIVPLLVLTFGVINSLLVLCVSLLAHSFFVCFSPKISFKADEDIVKSHFDHHGSRALTIYIMKLIAYSGMGVFCFYFINILFNSIVKAEFIYPDNIAIFLGGFFSLIGFASLALHVFINKYLVNRLGIAILLNLWPILIIACSAIIIVFMPTAYIIVPAIISLQFIDEMLRRGTLSEIQSLIYQPLSPDDRSWLENDVRPVVRLIVGFIASMLILVLDANYGMNITMLITGVIIVSAAMLYLIPSIKKLYTLNLVKALGKHHLISPDFTILDKTSLNILKSGLKSTHTEVALYSLDVLEKTNARFLPEAIEYCLHHDRSVIRKRALNKVRKHNFFHLRNDVIRCAQDDISADVRGEALITLGTIVGAGAIPMIKRYTDSDEPAIRSSAIISLLQSCGTDGALLASDKLHAMVEYPLPSERILAAKILLAIDIREFHNALKKLLHDDNNEVRKAALEVASKVPDPEIINTLIDCLNYPQLRVTAIRTLSKFNKLVIPKLAVALEESESVPDVFRSITIVLSQIDSPMSRDLLYHYIDNSNAKLRHSCLAALHQYHFKATSDAVNTKINSLLKMEASICIEILETLADIEKSNATFLLINLLESQFKQQQENIIYLLSFHYPEKGIMRAWDNLQSSDKKTSEYGIELLEGLLTVSHKMLLIPLLENKTVSERIQRLPQSQMHQQQGMPSRLRYILQRNTYFNPLIQASALYAATYMKLNDIVRIAEEKIQNPNPIIRETALWTLWFCRHINFAQHAKRLLTDPHPTVANVAKILMR